MKTTQTFEVSGTSTAQAERAANDDRLIPAWQIEFVHCLRVQVRGESLHLGLRSAPAEHVRRDVTAVDVHV